jgi:hypothetical protein
MTPKEKKSFAAIGQRYLKTRSEKMSVTMQIPVEDFLSEIGKLHMQNSGLQRQLHAANRRIAELNASMINLAKQVQAQKNAEDGGKVTEFPSPEQVASDVNEAIEANKTNQPA